MDGRALVGLVAIGPLFSGYLEICIGNYMLSSVIS